MSYPQTTKAAALSPDIQKAPSMVKTNQPSDTGEKSKGGNDRSKLEPKPARTGKDFGQEGTNKTIPVPKPDGAPSEELGNTPHVEKTPYTRG